MLKGVDNQCPFTLFKEDLKMKKERNARKQLLDLYLYMDMKNSYDYKNATEAMKKDTKK